MNPPARSLDDVDRLSFRLARIIREQFPQLSRHGFTLIDLEERLLPFRETRREMVDGGTESWERAMLRLLSGERDILKSETGLRDACLQALALPSPTLALVRVWSNSLLTLNTAEFRGASTDPAVRSHSAHGCRYCGSRLPDGRRSTFCPHCGIDLTKRQCPACSTELEITWRFCVTCGRGADKQSGPVLVARVAS